MFIVGVTGGIATGKSTVLAIFKAHGIPVIDADDVARKITEPGSRGLKEIVKHFGDAVLLRNGQLNRPYLADIVFRDVAERTKLNAITHPRIQNAIIKTAFKYFLLGHQYVAMELPLLFETMKMMPFIHKIITVTCDDVQQLSRLNVRNDLSIQLARRRVEAQMPLIQKVAKSDFVIDNAMQPEWTTIQTEIIIKMLDACQFTWYFRFALGFISVFVLAGLWKILEMLFYR